MIKSIELHNFQSHDKTVIKLHPGVNIITAASEGKPNNCGKTAILRGLEWVRTSRPTGGSIVRRGAEDWAVTIITDSHTVTRARKKDKNTYVVDGELLQAIGSDVPEQVTDILNLHNLNIQNQLEPHFLILESPGKIAKAVNDTVHLDDAENAATSLNSAVRDSAKEEKAATAQYVLLERDLRAFDKLPVYRHTLEAATSAEAILERSRVKVEAFDCVIIKLKAEKAKKLPDPARLLKILNHAKGLSETIEKVENRAGKLSLVLANISKYKKAGLLKKPLKEIDASTDEGSKLIKACSNKEDESNKLNDLIEKIQSAGRRKQGLVIEIKKTGDAYNKLLAELDNCPSCGQELTKDAKACLLKG